MKKPAKFGLDATTSTTPTNPAMTPADGTHAMDHPPFGDELVSRLIKLQGEERVTVLSMIILMSQVSAESRRQACTMITQALDETARADDLDARLREILSYLESRSDGVNA